MEEVCNAELFDLPSKVGDHFVQLVTEKLDENLVVSPYVLIISLNNIDVPPHYTLIHT